MLSCQLHVLNIPHSVLLSLATCPTSQSVQEAAPSSELMWFSSQALHSVWLAERYCPAGQGTEIFRASGFM